MSVKVLTEHHLECLSLKGGCIGSSESTIVKMSHRWKSHDTAQLYLKHVRFQSNSYVLHSYRERMNAYIYYSPLHPRPHLTHTNLNPFPEDTGCDHN